MPSILDESSMTRGLLSSLIVLWVMAVSLGTALAGQEGVTLLEAVRQTLENSPGVKIEKELVTQKAGVLQTTSGQFDMLATAGASLGTTRVPYSTAQQITRASSGLPWLDTFREDTDTYYLGLTQQFRTGVSVTPMLSARSLQNNNDQTDLVNYSEASLRITVPLLRGLGVEATGADEMAASANLTAARSLSRHNISRRVYTTIAAYWDLLGSQQMLATAIEGRARAEEFHKLILRLIKGGELAPNFSNQVQANLFSRDADLARTRLSLYRGQQSLGLAMGYGPAQLAATPQARGEIPAVPPQPAGPDQDRQRLVQRALQTRLDYDALEKDMDAARILVEKADNFRLPDLKVSFKGGYAGLSETSAFDHYYNSLNDQMRGLNFNTMLTLELPIQNNAARGEFLRRKSVLSEIRLRLADLSNGIASEVLIALEAVARARQEHDLADQSARQYRLSVEVATARFKQGEGTVNEVLDQEDKYFTAQLTRINAQQKFAVAMAQLRYATGTLVQGQDEELTFSPSSLVEMPFADQGANQGPREVINP
jgi:outer membrane protein TolC